MDLHERFEVLMPSLDKTDEQSESILETEQAKALIEYQRKFEYASRPHVIMEILWHTGIRLGALHALDVDDYDEENERMIIRHRPDLGTPLKTGRREGESSL